MKPSSASISFFVFFLLFSITAQCRGGAPAADKPAAKKISVQTVPPDTAPSKKTAPLPSMPAAGSDTLVILARLTEIPGKFAPNDLYNYVYIMKYRVIKVLKGVFSGQEILVGHYNPLIPRKRITDDMDPLVDGDVTKFETGDKHRLVLITPIERVWKDAVEDDYSDSDADKYYALKADIAR